MIMEDASDCIMKKIWKKFLFPSVFSRVSTYAISSLCSFFLISQYCGKNELVVFSMFEPILQLKKAFEAYWGNGSAQEFSRLKGAGNSKEAQNLFAEALTGYLLLGTAVYGLLCFSIPWLTADIFNLQDLRGMGIAFGIPFMLYLFCSSITYILLKYIACDSMPRYNAAIILIVNCSMLVFQIIFIGMLRMNMKGYLYAGFLSEVIAFIGCIAVFFLSRQATLHIRFRLPRMKTISALWNFSCGTLLKTMLSFVGNILVMRWILTGYGKDVVTIYALGHQINSLVYAFSCGYFDAIQMLTSMFRGEKNRNGLVSTWRRGFFYGIRAQIVLIAVMFLLAPVLVKYMLSANADFDRAVWGIRIMTAFLIFSFPMDFRIIYYNACGHAKLVSLCSICNEIITHIGSVAIFYFLGIAEKWFWFSWGIDRAGQFLMVVLLAELWRRCKKFSNRMLLEPASRRLMLTMNLKASPDDLEDYREMLVMFVKRNGLPDRKTRRVELLFEELFLFAAEKIKGGKQNIFFITTEINSSGQVHIELKYDSAESCLHSYLCVEKYNVFPDQMAGVRILKKLSDSIRVDRVLGINTVSIQI